MNLYLLKTEGFGEYYVLAKHPTEAQEKLETKMDIANYGYCKSRKVKRIDLISQAIYDDHNKKPFFCSDNRLIL